MRGEARNLVETILQSSKCHKNAKFHRHTPNRRRPNRECHGRPTGYLYFSRDWWRHFTVRVVSHFRPLFDRVGLAFGTYEGKLVQGWLKSFNGPLIDVTHPNKSSC